MTHRVGDGVADDLFSPGDGDDGRDVRLGTHAGVLRGFALAWERGLVRELDAVVAHAPFRHMLTPGGFRMSVAMTNCGEWGWISDPTGYRYTTIDPQTGRPRGTHARCLSRARNAGRRPAWLRRVHP